MYLSKNDILTLILSLNYHILHLFSIFSLKIHHFSAASDRKETLLFRFKRYTFKNMSGKDDSRSFRFIKTDFSRTRAGSSGRGSGIRLPLLEYLAAACGCMYLSDLRQRQYQAGLGRTLRTAAPEWFPVQEWRDAAEYLTGEIPEAGSRRKIRAHLMRRFSGM